MKSGNETEKSGNLPVILPDPECAICGGTGWVYWMFDDETVEASVQARDDCPRCASGEPEESG